jgi:ribosomal-protein-serine acetyltransferase
VAALVSEPLLDLGDGLEVRVLGLEDAQELLSLIQAERERLRPWMPWAETTRGLDDVRTFLEHTRTTDDLDGLGIVAEGALVGGIGLLFESSGIDGELGCWVASSHEGRGVAARACGGLIQLAFDRLSLHRVSCLVAAENARSVAFVERLGFTREGLVREGARAGPGFQDLVLYGLLEQEWTPP